MVIWCGCASCGRNAFLGLKRHRRRLGPVIFRPSNRADPNERLTFNRPAPLRFSVSERLQRVLSSVSFLRAGKPLPRPTHRARVHGRPSAPRRRRRIHPGRENKTVIENPRAQPFGQGGHRVQPSFLSRLNVPGSLPMPVDRDKKLKSLGRVILISKFPVSVSGHGRVDISCDRPAPGRRVSVVYS